MSPCAESLRQNTSGNCNSLAINNIFRHFERSMTLEKLLKEADAVRERVSGYSDEKRAALEERARAAIRASRLTKVMTSVLKYLRD